MIVLELAGLQAVMQLAEELVEQVALRFRRDRSHRLGFAGKCPLAAEDAHSELRVLRNPACASR